MSHHHGTYKSFVFDCDGVIFDSNTIKTHAFYEAAKVFSHDAAVELCTYHKCHGGVSRYMKFDYFIDNILPKYHSCIDIRDIPKSKRQLKEYLLRRYVGIVEKGVSKCAIADQLLYLRQLTKEQQWLVVSGSDQDELNRLFCERGIAHYFDGGIYGSPRTKTEILKTLEKNEALGTPALFFGDSFLDFQTSKILGMDFIFISQWTDMPDWEVFCQANEIPYAINLMAAFEMTGLSISACTS